MSPQLFLCVMDRADGSFYDAIKRAAALELVAPVPSQVVNTKKALNERGMMQYCANVGMKIVSSPHAFSHSHADAEPP